MNKYQKYFIEKTLCRNGEFALRQVYSVNSGDVCGTIDFGKREVTVNQEEDIFSLKYKAVLDAWGEGLSLAGDSVYAPVIKGVYVKKSDNQWKELDNGMHMVERHKAESTVYEIPLDFDDRTSAVKLSFAGGLVDDMIFKVVYNEADKDAYYNRKKEAERRALISQAHIEYVSCVNFLQVYFTPCNGDYNKAEVSLYRGKDQFMADYASVKGVFCITAMGLGHGDYCFVYRQFDKNGKIIFETRKIDFTVDDTSRRKQLG
ncbi:MAG: hypothetical protein NC099_04195 [Corallococcus sp.]|nr:hypothetical protein [Corallococcus sp.]